MIQWVRVSHNFISLLQSESAATKAVRESAWTPRAGSGAYFATTH